MSEHGTRSRYTRGCRCDGCREANRVYITAWNRKRGVKPQKLGRTHGKVATYTWGCRCEACRRANTERKRRWLAKPENRARWNAYQRSRRTQ